MNGLSRQQSVALQLFLSGKHNMFVTGSAGTGKTHLLSR
jgi:predicted ATPase with chaperone activity